MAQARKKSIHPQAPPKAAIGVDGSDQRWWVAGLCLVLAAITFAVFGQTLRYEFIDCDDGAYVYENAKVAGGLSLKGLAWVFTHSDCYLYHPLTMLSLMADDQFHGLHAGGYHFTNVLLHTATVILLFLVLRQMTGALWRSAFVAAVFAIHPLRVESVAWVAERKDVLSGMFFMLTLGAYVRYVRQPNSLARYLEVVAAFVLALLSKPSVVTLPFVLLLLDYWPLRRFEQTGPVRPPEYFGIPKRLILEKLPLLALAAGACALTVPAAGKWIATTDSRPMLARIGNAFLSYVVYLRQMVWPVGLTPYYPLPEKGYPVWTIAVSILLFALITGGVLAFWRKRRWLLVGWLWYLGMLTPMIGLVRVGAFAHADRMTYLAQIGVYLALTWLVAEWSAGWRYRRETLGGLAALILGALFFCARTQTAYWKDSETLWDHTLACTTRNYVAQNNLAIALDQKGKLDEAITHYQDALQIKSDGAEAHLNLGVALYKRGRVDEAIIQYQKALQITPDLAGAHNNFGNALLKKGKVDEAMAHFQEALQSEPDYADPHNNLGNVLLRMGKVDEAIAHFRQALEINPNYVEAHNDLGIALDRKGSVDEAIAHFQRALEIDPTSAEAHYNLGNAFLQKGRVSEAITHFRQALQIVPNNPAMQNNLAWVLATCVEASLRNGNEAVELARQANALTGGKNPILLHTLAAAFAEAGQFSEAVKTAQYALDLAEAQSNTGLIAALQSEIKLYQAGVPFHMPAQTH